MSSSIDQLNDWRNVDQSTQTVSIEPTGTPTVEIVIPVYNEEVSLPKCIMQLSRYLETSFPYSYFIAIADNASNDKTWNVAQALVESYPNVGAIHLDAKGRGRALHQTWLASNATVLAYMDVDLSTDLDAFLPLIAPLVSGHSDIAIGSRLARSSNVDRGPKREIISRCYNAILKTALRVHFSDAQCGFKAMRSDCARVLLPLVEDKTWFFDTELLVLAERSGLRIHEVPVDWNDDPDSRVDIVSTASDDLKGVVRMIRGFMSGTIPIQEIGTRLGRSTEPTKSTMTRQLMSFGTVGVLSTVLYMVLFASFDNSLGAQLANLFALCLTTAFNTSMNRRFTFRLRSVDRPMRMHLEGYAVFAIALALTSGTLAVLNAGGSNYSTIFELAATTLANAAATVLRFTLFRLWVFNPRRHQSPTQLATQESIQCR